ncbi:MAG: helix-turn-helix transcriptional regulator [Clostridiales bacterium]|nr:helix-turn-helix transcriptional regulator [Clostridiales bacterium]
MEERFNEILSRLRHEKGVSQREAAAALGISQALLSHYENGVREPGLIFLAQACEYYGVSADYILGRSAYRHKLDFSQEQLANSESFFGSCIELVRAAFTLEDDIDRCRMGSMVSAMLYSISAAGADSSSAHRELVDALIFLRRAQLSEAFSKAGFTLPEAIRFRTEEELSMLFNK